MPNINTRQIAEEWRTNAWGWESKSLNDAIKDSPDSRVALCVLTAMWDELRMIRTLLACGNLRRAAIAVPKIEDLLKRRRKVKARR